MRGSLLMASKSRCPSWGWGVGFKNRHACPISNLAPSEHSDPRVIFKYVTMILMQQIHEPLKIQNSMFLDVLPQDYRVAKISDIAEKLL